MKLSRMIVTLLCLSLPVAGVLAAGPATPKSPAEGTTGPKIAKQSFCPPCEMKLDPKAEQYVDVEGYRIYVCSSYCGEKVKKNPSVYIKKIQDAGETPATIPGKQASRASHACDKCAIKKDCTGTETSPGTAKK